LHFVVIPAPPFAAFVFDRNRSVAAKLDEIAYADNPKPMRHDPQPASRPPRRLIGILGSMNATMIERSGGGMDILDPNPFDAMKKTPPLAKEQIIQRRQRWISVGIGGEGERQRHQRDPKDRPSLTTL
jgi:hypothetical protein